MNSNKRLNDGIIQSNIELNIKKKKFDKTDPLIFNISFEKETNNNLIQKRKYETNFSSVNKKYKINNELSNNLDDNYILKYEFYTN